MSRKFIIDVDTGTDDMQALMMATSYCMTGKIKILAVTCAAGNVPVEQTAINTLRVLQHCGGPKIKVYKGAASPLLGSLPAEPSCHGSDGLGDMGLRDHATLGRCEVGPSSVAMVKLVNKYPGEITIVALAPLTNIALAHHLDPTFGSKLKSLVIMGGNIEGRGRISLSAEFNFFCDPEAAYICLKKLECPSIQIVPYEVCLRTLMPWEWYDELAATDTALAYIHGAACHIINRTKRQSSPDGYYTCDPCAMLVALNPSTVVRKIRASCTVELCGSLTRGKMLFDPCEDSNIEVIMEINVELLKSYLKIMLLC